MSALQLLASSSLLSGCAAKERPVFISLFIFKSVSYLLISHFICFASMRPWFAKCISAQFIAGKTVLVVDLCTCLCVCVCVRVCPCVFAHVGV